MTEPHVPEHRAASDEVAVSDDPVPNPGLPEHLPRPTDVDEALERRAERQVASLFLLAGLMSVLFCIAYFSVGSQQTFLGYGAQNLALGGTLGLALLAIGVGAIQWARKLMSDHEIVEIRHSAASSPDDQKVALDALHEGTAESGIGRRPLIRNSLLGAMAMLGLPAIVLFRDLGPLPGRAYYHTVWRRGVRIVVDVSGTPLRPEDLSMDTLVNAEPELFFPHRDASGNVVPATYEGTALQVEKAKAAVVVVRMPPEEIHASPRRKSWGVDGILCYSKICTHVGCPISLWEKQTRHLLCPCHQSTFDLADNGKVLFGPAGRPLPQLPIMVDSAGYLVAQSDFHEPVGPSFWERG